MVPIKDIKKKIQHSINQLIRSKGKQIQGLNVTPKLNKTKHTSIPDPLQLQPLSADTPLTEQKRIFKNKKIMQVIVHSRN